MANSQLTDLLILLQSQCWVPEASSGSWGRAFPVEMEKRKEKKDGQEEKSNKFKPERSSAALRSR
jgi:hypothetical protein